MTERRSNEEQADRHEPTGKLISESILPLEGTFDVSAMSRGEPGLPVGFTWRGATFRIISCESVWKRRGPDSTGTELYLRRHYCTLLMDDRSMWTVYCLRQPPSSGSVRKRWFLYTRTGSEDE